MPASTWAATPSRSKFAATAAYAPIRRWRYGQVVIGNTIYDHDVYIRVDGKVKDRKKCPPGKMQKACHMVGAEEIEKVCKGGPEMLFVATGRAGRARVGKDAAEFLRSAAIEWRALPTPCAIAAYNRCGQRKAILLHVTC